MDRGGNLGQIIAWWVPRSVDEKVFQPAVIVWSKNGLCTKHDRINLYLRTSKHVSNNFGTRSDVAVAVKLAALDELEGDAGFLYP